MAWEEGVVYTPLFLRGGGGGVEPATKFSKSTGLTESQFLKEVCLERRG